TMLYIRFLPQQLQLLSTLFPYTTLFRSHIDWKKFKKSNGANQNVLRWRHLSEPAKSSLIFFTGRAIAPRPLKLGSPNLALFHEKSPFTKWLSQKIQKWAP